MSKHRTKYHRDGTVTIWDVYAQAWVRWAARDVPDEIMATLNDGERARICKMAKREEWAA